MIFKQLTGRYTDYLKGRNIMTKVSPMKNKKNQAKTVRIDRKRTRKDQDLAMQADRNSKRADQLIECGYNKFRLKFTKEIIIGQYQDFFKELLDARKMNRPADLSSWSISQNRNPKS